MPRDSSEDAVQRELGLGSAAAAGEAIAVGIFLTPAGMSKALGSPFWLLAVWLFVLLLLVLLVARSPRQPALGCLAVLRGLPLYQFARRKPEDSGVQVPFPKASGE